MARQVPQVAARETTTVAVGLQSPSFEERWAAWQAKGAAHERAVRRKMALAAPVVIVVIAVLFYVLVGR
jgi:small-conductance mechanosensitive channel